MFRAAWKSLLSRKTRLLMSALAIVLGVAFVSGSFIFTHMLSASFNGIMKGTVADVNVDPVGTYTSNSQFSDSAAKAGQVLLTEANIAQMAAVDGVNTATGAVFSVNTYPIGKNGKVIATIGPPAIATNWYTDPAYGNQPGVVLKSGHEPQADDEVVVDPTTLDKGGYALGDTMKISLPSGDVVSKKIVGTALWGGGGSVGATYLFFTTPEAQKLLLGGKDGYTSAWITAKSGVDIPDLVTKVQAVTPKNFEAVSGQTAADNTASQVNKAMSFITTFLLVFAAIALLVASFLIVNTFSIIVAQRGRELALFRAIGASRKQVTRTVLFEAAVTGFIGSTLGLLIGWLLALAIRGVFKSMGMDLGSTLPTLTGQAVLASYGVGMLVTLFASWLPARRAGRVPPVAAMGGEVMTGSSDLGRRAIVGSSMAIVGAAAMGVALWTSISHRAAVLGVGAGLVVLGVAIASTMLGHPLIVVLGALYRRLFGQVGRLAELNAVRQPRRTAATASALMLSLALVTTLSVLGSSASKSIHSVVATTSRSDFTLQSITRGLLPPSLPKTAAGVSGVQSVYSMYSAVGLVNDKQSSFTVLDPSGFNRIFEQTLVSGHLNQAENSVLVNQDAATSAKLVVGSKLPIVLPTREKLTLTVSGIYSSPKGISLGNYIVNEATGKTMGATDGPFAIAVEKSPDASAGDVRKALDDATASLPTVVVMDNNDMANQATSQVDGLLRMIYALLGLAIVIAVLGIINTLALSVIERTREIGLLRAVGVTRSQLRRMITLESVAIALLGSVLGVTLGMAFGASLQHVLSDNGLSELVFPWGQLALYLVAAAVVGVVAAVWPARRAARLDVLQAIAAD